LSVCFPQRVFNCLYYLKAKYPENYHSHKQLDGGDKFSNTKLSRLASQWFNKKPLDKSTMILKRRNIVQYITKVHFLTL
jgi:hypothetical protein